jgi:deazaflavin-dependent oxidoreductase (nitroreductase family)
MAERRAPGWLKWVNPINRFLLRRGIGPPPQHLLVTTGRRSGNPHATPIAVLAFEGERYLVAGYDGADWVKNARATGRAVLRRGRKLENVVLLEVPVGERAAVLRQFAQKVRGGRSFLDADAASRHPVFRVAPGNMSGSVSGDASGDA